MTTCETGLDGELETRLLSLTVTDTPEQTKAIFEHSRATRGHLTICSKLHAKRDQCIVARVRRFGAKVAASFVSHATAPGVRCHAAPHSVT